MTSVGGEGEGRTCPPIPNFIKVPYTFFYSEGS
jgi:hypothetical protein